MSLVLSIFQSSIRTQRNAIAAQSVQESVRFALEVMSKELRSSVISNVRIDNATTVNDCEVSATQKVFNEYVNGVTEGLYFKNRFGECVYYYLNGDRLTIDRDGIALPITPDDIMVSGLAFDIIDDDIGDYPSVQPRVTMKMHVEMKNTLDTQAMDLQLTMTSRQYE